MFEPRPPIFVYDLGDLTVHRSVQDALSYVEPWCVTETLEASDADGHRIKIKAEGVTKTRFTVGDGETLFDREASGELAPEALAAILQDYLHGSKWDDEWIKTASLDNLVAAMVEFYGFSESTSCAGPRQALRSIWNKFPHRLRRCWPSHRHH